MEDISLMNSNREFDFLHAFSISICKARVYANFSFLKYLLPHFLSILSSSSAGSLIFQDFLCEL